MNFIGRSTFWHKVLLDSLTFDFINHFELKIPASFSH